MDGTDSKWTATTASIWIQSVSGGSYAFSIYSSVLKSSQSYSQSTLDTISVFKDIGANVGIISGLLYAAVVSRRSSGYMNSFCGPWVVHLVGAIQCFLGYFLMWLAVTDVIHRPPVVVMCLFMFLAAHAQTFFNTANVVTGVRNFEEYSGTIVGIMKGFLGLSGAMLIQFYQALFKGKPSMFILMLAILPTVISLLLMCLVRIDPQIRGGNKKPLNGYSVVALVIAAFMTVIILENVLTLPSWAGKFIVIVLVLLLLLPLKISAQAQREDSIVVNEPMLVESENLIAENQLEYDELLDDTAEAGTSSGDKMVRAGQSVNIIAAMKTMNFWLLFVAMACGMGSGLATINNMSQIGQSFAYNSVEINSLVSLWSIWNFLGRFGAGYVSDILLHRKGWARPVFIAITLATMTFGHLIIASGFSGNLYIGTILVGVCYGSQWSLMPTITSELFGVLHMGTIFNTIAVASPVGSYVLSVWVIGQIYDEKAGTSGSCYGTGCFMLSFLVLASVSLLGFLVALTLFFRTKSFYRCVVLRRLHNLQTK